MSRRARKRAEGRVVLNAVEIAINRARPLAAADVAGQKLAMELALREFCRGAHCDAHWRSLADAANMAETLAGMGLGSGDEANHVINTAQKALHDVHQRHAARGTWTLYADEIDALHWLVRLHCTAQLPACSYGEFCDAFTRTQNRLRQALAGNAPAGALVVAGGLGANPPLEG
jgi:hypothetical protein